MQKIGRKTSNYDDSEANVNMLLVLTQILKMDFSSILGVLNFDFFSFSSPVNI